MQNIIVMMVDIKNNYNFKDVNEHTVQIDINCGSNNQVHVAQGIVLVAQMIKCLPAMWETRVQSLGPEDRLEKEMATHSSTLAWKTPWTEEPGIQQSMEWQSQTRLSDFTFTFIFSQINTISALKECTQIRFTSTIK